MIGFPIAMVLNVAFSRGLRSLSMQSHEMESIGNTLTSDPAAKTTESGLAVFIGAHSAP
jgi:hypothetical protein